MSGWVLRNGGWWVSKRMGSNGGKMHSKSNYYVITPSGVEPAHPMKIRTRLIRIGNSRGIRLPKPVIEHAGIEDDVDLTLQDGRVIIEAAGHPRSDWDTQFQDADESNQDEILLPEMESAWDDEEWEWK